MSLCCRYAPVHRNGWLPKHMGTPSQEYMVGGVQRSQDLSKEALDAQLGLMLELQAISLPGLPYT